MAKRRARFVVLTCDKKAVAGLVDHQTVKLFRGQTVLISVELLKRQRAGSKCRDDRPVDVPWLGV